MMLVYRITIPLIAIFGIVGNILNIIVLRSLSDIYDVDDDDDHDHDHDDGDDDVNDYDDDDDDDDDGEVCDECSLLVQLQSASVQGLRLLLSQGETASFP